MRLTNLRLVKAGKALAEEKSRDGFSILIGSDGSGNWVRFWCGAAGHNAGIMNFMGGGMIALTQKHELRAAQNAVAGQLAIAGPWLPGQVVGRGFDPHSSFPGLILVMPSPSLDSNSNQLPDCNFMETGRSCAGDGK